MDKGSYITKSRYLELAKGARDERGHSPTPYFTSCGNSASKSAIFGAADGFIMPTT